MLSNDWPSTKKKKKQNKNSGLDWISSRIKVMRFRCVCSNFCCILCTFANERNMYVSFIKFFGCSLSITLLQIVILFPVERNLWVSHLLSLAHFATMKCYCCCSVAAVIRFFFVHFLLPKRLPLKLLLTILNAVAVIVSYELK